MLGYDDVTANENLRKLIAEWEKAAEKERLALIEAKRNGEINMAEGLWGGLAVYRTCISQLRKLL